MRSSGRLRLKSSDTTELLLSPGSFFIMEVAINVTTSPAILKALNKTSAASERACSNTIECPATRRDLLHQTKLLDVVAQELPWTSLSYFYEAGLDHVI
jgi:hypothetical protein